MTRPHPRKTRLNQGARAQLPGRTALRLSIVLVVGCGSTGAGNTTSPKTVASDCADEGSALCRHVRVAQLAENSTPRYFPSFANKCIQVPEDSKRNLVRAIMKDGMNPAFTRIAHLAHHDSRVIEDRMAEIADAAAVLIGCARLMTDQCGKVAIDATESTDACSAYDHMLLPMQEMSYALQLAALEENAADVGHWYGHVKLACSTCHARFWNPPDTEPGGIPERPVDAQ